MTLNPWRLRLLCQLEALGTVRAVAAAAHQSASSVSQQLAVLESETGARLLERTGRRVQLTSTGHLLASRARDILDRMADAEAELRALGQDPSGVVRVAAFQSAIHSLVVPATVALRLAHPGVEVHIDELEPHESTSALLRGDVDIAVTTTDFLDAPRHPDVHLVPLRTDAIVVVVPPGHRVARQERVDLAALADEDWAFDLPGTYMDDLATRLCRQAGFEPRVVGRFNNYLIALQHVESAGSVTLLPELAVDPRYAVVARDLVPPTYRRITAAIRSSSAARASVTVVLDALSGAPA
ncbi:MAG TPA: LysR substrate-binding domain-containing protein [Jatrophihabitans sp.]|uniref:LysR family transcriptional regulator n=1 Tax=Jatrophihabitans sp. TaxID=1932789 RepID=UPI002DF88C8B|nr:LysR substrate-binding domain-containing protein [Jatrophihabitans sp.]